MSESFFEATDVAPAMGGDLGSTGGFDENEEAVFVGFPSPFSLLAGCAEP